MNGDQSSFMDQSSYWGMVMDGPKHRCVGAVRPPGYGTNAPFLFGGSRDILLLTGGWSAYRSVIM